MAHVLLYGQRRTACPQVALRYSRRRFGRVVEPVAAAAHHSGVLLAMGALETAAERGWHRLDHHLRWLAIQVAATDIGCSWCTDYGYYEGVQQGIDARQGTGGRALADERRLRRARARRARVRRIGDVDAGEGARRAHGHPAPSLQRGGDRRAGGVGCLGEFPVALQRRPRSPQSGILRQLCVLPGDVAARCTPLGDLRPCSETADPTATVACTPQQPARGDPTRPHDVGGPVTMAQATAGVDLGGTKIQAVVLSAGDVVGQARHPTPNTNADDVVSEIVASIHSALDDAGIDDRRTSTPSPSGHPGRWTSATGHVSNARNVPGFMEDVALGPTVSAAFGGTPVLVDNDVRAAVMGEFRRGAGRPFRTSWACSSGPASGAGSSSKASSGTAGAVPVRSATPRSSRAADGAGAPAWAASRPTPGGSRSSRRRAGRVEKGQKTKLFEIMERKGRDRVHQLGHRRCPRAERPAHRSSSSTKPSTPRGWRCPTPRTSSISRPSSSGAASGTAWASPSSAGSSRP